MKKRILFLNWLIFSTLCYSQIGVVTPEKPSDNIEIDNEWKSKVLPIFQGLNKSRVPHGILKDFAMEFADLNAYNGILTDSNYVGTNVLGNIYKTLIMGNVTTSAPYFTKLEDVAQNWVTERVNRNQEQKNTLVLAGIYYKYAQINENALVQNKIIVSNQKYYDKYIDGVWQNPYEVKEVIAFAPPINAYNKYQVKAVLPDNLLLGNSLTDIQQIELNFNDGQGYQVLQLG